ncbi:unnamed protein product [Cuscuta europaea]|uniref:DUF7953 domain-containing protein n=1 Tax=Cuscuta europaea TaxID=41803 RepID=A0A9P0Z962_CUSEU|nr:unnamed protein product [Cuscuta europaea]
MTIRRLLGSTPRIIVLLYSSILLSWIPEPVTAAVVTLDSIQIFQTHELFGRSPTVYFQCKGENKTILPDVKKKDILYDFKGEESWQPLTQLLDKKCKRCGFYEEDTIKSDDVFDEWEFCASEFTSADGKYTHFKEKEFNATFWCPECVPLVGAPVHSYSQNEQKGMSWTIVLLMVALASVILVLGGVIAHRYWQKRKRQQDQARFLKLFEEQDDDMDDELGIGPLTNVI